MGRVTFGCGVQRLRQAKVQHLDGPVLAHLDVRGLQVAVNDTSLMSSLQRLCNLLGSRQSFIDWDRALRDPISEGRPLHQLQHQCTGALRLFKTVNGCDVRMVETGEDLRLTLEPRQPIRISRKRLGQDLQRHLTVQLGVGGLIDLGPSRPRR